MLTTLKVAVLEFIVVDELCEFNGRENLADTDITITSLVRTESVDAVPKRRLFC